MRYLRAAGWYALGALAALGVVTVNPRAQVELLLAAHACWERARAAHRGSSLAAAPVYRDGPTGW